MSYDHPPATVGDAVSVTNAAWDELPVPGRARTAVRGLLLAWHELMAGVPEFPAGLPNICIPASRIAIEYFRTRDLRARPVATWFRAFNPVWAELLSTGA